MQVVLQVKKTLVLLFIILSLFMVACTTEESCSLIDTASINKVDGYYVGQGQLNGNDIYIVQPKKDNKLCNNLEISSSDCEIIEIDDEKNTKVEVYEKVFKTEENDKVARESKLYYKIYVSEDFIIDVGELEKK